jgi:hypothetical protein
VAKRMKDPEEVLKATGGGFVSLQELERSIKKVKRS